MDKKPLVSVLMSAYNEEEWISKSIDSILNQTYNNFEFIIVNDGSKDNTIKILKKYEKKDSRIKIIDQKNTGLTKALNNGLKYCKGKYIARMDADNEALSKRLEKQVNFLEKNINYDLVGSWRRDIFDDGHSRILKFPVESNAIKRGLMRSCIISHSSVMIKADLLKKYKYNENFKTSQDYELWMRLGDSIEFYNLAEVLSNAYHRVNSITRTKKKFDAMKIQIKIKKLGYKNLKRPMWEQVYILKPTLEFILPEKLIQKYVSLKMSKK